MHVGATKMSVADKKPKSNSAQTRKNVEGRLRPRHGGATKRKPKPGALKRRGKQKSAGERRGSAADRKTSSRRKPGRTRRRSPLSRQMDSESWPARPARGGGSTAGPEMTSPAASR